MANKIIDETSMISKYLLNNAAKAAETAKVTSNSKSSADNKAQGTGISDILELSANYDPYVYANYNALGQYETMPSLVDYLEDNDKDRSSGLSGDTDSMPSSLAEYLNGSGSGTDSYDSVFSALADASEARTDLLIEQALNKLGQTDNKETS